MIKCPYCSKKINKYNSYHIYHCDKKLTNDKIQIKFDSIKFNHKYISQKNEIYNEYVLNNKSLPELYNEYNISYKNILFLLDYYEIRKRTKIDSSKTISVEKYKKTCKEKYGVDNVSKLKHIKEQKNRNNKTIKLIDQLNNNKNIYNWLRDESQFGNIRKLYNDTNNLINKKELNLLNRLYYKYWYNLTDDEKNNLLNKQPNIEHRISTVLDKLNLSYVKNFTIGEKRYDFKLNNTSIIIEVNSDFWHANPKIYNSDDFLEYPFKKEKSKNIWEKDKNKNKYAKKNGYVIIYIWEYDMLNLSDNELLSNLSDIIISNLSKINN